jgi:hypothetical protein
MIALIAAVVIMLGGVMWVVFSAPKPTPPAPPEQVITAPAQIQAASVVYANSLPGGGSGSGGAAGGAAGGATPAGGGSRGSVGAPVSSGAAGGAMPSRGGGARK